MTRAIAMNANDNVATMMNEVASGETIILLGPGFEVKVLAKNDIPFGHKIAMVDISEGEKIIKYGEKIGNAVNNITKGEHVHLHNLMSSRGRGDLAGTK